MISLAQENDVLWMRRRKVVAPPLPASAVEYWHSQMGLGLASATKIQSWTGQVRGSVVQAPSAGLQPTIGADAGYFNNKPVVQFAAGTTLWTSPALVTALTAAGTKPHMFCVARWRSTGASQALVGFYDSLPSAASYAAGSFLFQNANLLRTWWYPLTEIQAAFTSNDVQRFETLIDATGRVSLRWNDTVYATSGSGGLVSPSATKGVQFGADRGSLPSNACLAFVLLSASEPSAGEKAALNAWAASEFAA